MTYPLFSCLLSKMQPPFNSMSVHTVWHNKRCYSILRTLALPSLFRSFPSLPTSTIIPPQCLPLACSSFWWSEASWWLRWRRRGQSRGGSCGAGPPRRCQTLASGPIQARSRRSPRCWSPPYTAARSHETGQLGPPAERRTQRKRQSKLYRLCHVAVTLSCNKVFNGIIIS